LDEDKEDWLHEEMVKSEVAKIKVRNHMPTGSRWIPR